MNVNTEGLLKVQIQEQEGQTLTKSTKVPTLWKRQNCAIKVRNSNPALFSILQHVHETERVNNDGPMLAMK